MNANSEVYTCMWQKKVLRFPYPTNFPWISDSKNVAFSIHPNLKYNPIKAKKKQHYEDNVLLSISSNNYYYYYFYWLHFYN